MTIYLHLNCLILIINAVLWQISPPIDFNFCYPMYLQNSSNCSLLSTVEYPKLAEYSFSSFSQPILLPNCNQSELSKRKVWQCSLRCLKICSDSHLPSEWSQRTYKVLVWTYFSGLTSCFTLSCISCSNNTESLIILLVKPCVSCLWALHMLCLLPGMPFTTAPALPPSLTWLSSFFCQTHSGNFSDYPPTPLYNRA